MSNNEMTKKIEQISYEHIPVEERNGNPKELFFTWFAASTVSTTLVTGALAIIVGLNFWWAAFAIVLGHLIGATIMALHSAQGPKLGIPQLIQSRAQFGYFGVLIPMVIVLTMYFGYGSMNTILVGQGIYETLNININFVIIISLIPMVLLAIYGQNLIQKSMKLYTYFFVLVFIVLTGLIITQISLDVLSEGAFSWAGFIVAVSVCVTWQITYGPYVSDHSRFMRPHASKKTFAYTYLGSFLSSTWLMLLGAALATVAINGNIMAVIKNMGVIGFTIVILLSLGVLVINSLNIYGAGIIVLSIASNFWSFRTTGRLRIITYTMIGIVIAMAATIGAGNFMTYFQVYLEFVLFFIIPWSVINLVDFYILKRRNYTHKDFHQKNGAFGKLNYTGISIYLIVILGQIPFINTEIYQGVLSQQMNGLDIAWITGSISAFILYVISIKIKNKRFQLQKVSI